MNFCVVFCIENEDMKFKIETMAGNVNIMFFPTLLMINRTV